jgi:hypothetical protein
MMLILIYLHLMPREKRCNLLFRYKCDKLIHFRMCLIKSPNLRFEFTGVVGI